ncbi:MAG: hypothetical protein A3K09_08420 [Nitrospinae bacterium RIFCSPLOWO2_12_FULL_47_7]|nr:MAG: hypothetical protein A3K09_08420 [Nitrospinae bacterium RIFCSPLOWO2_12_FULL_47_7]
MTDRATNLMWMQRDSWLELNHLVSWNRGQEFAKEKNALDFAGYHDWRFPTGNEAKDLFDLEASNTDREGCEIHIDPIFTKGCGYTTWTNEARGAKSVMGYDYRADYEYWLAKENDGFPSGVRLVRDIISTVTQQKNNPLVDNGNGTISDHETGLMWKKSDSYLDLDKWVSWPEAKTYCNELNQQEFAGYNDWKMPSRKEAMSIYDPSHPTKDIYGDVVFLNKAFPPGAGITTWTRTLSKEDKTLAIRFHYYNGDYKWHGRGLRSHGVRAVRIFKKTGKTETSDSD